MFTERLKSSDFLSGRMLLLNCSFRKKGRAELNVTDRQAVIEPVMSPNS